MIVNLGKMLCIVLIIIEIVLLKFTIIRFHVIFYVIHCWGKWGYWHGLDGWVKVSVCLIVKSSFADHEYMNARRNRSICHLQIHIDGWSIEALVQNFKNVIKIKKESFFSEFTIPNRMKEKVEISRFIP